MDAPASIGRPSRCHDRVLIPLLVLAPALLGSAPIAAQSAEPADPLFAERSARLGIDFRHHHYGTGERYMPENMGPGVVLFDANGDRRLDLYFLQGAPLGRATDIDAAPDIRAINRLFVQLESGAFRDDTERSGLGDAGYGMGAAFGDIDGDGDLDLYVTNYGRNALYRNRGDGRFEDITEKAGTGHPGWSTGAGFFDYDADSDLDLFVVNYVDFTFDNHKWCGSAERKLRSYCHPDVYRGLPDVLYRNDGQGRFTDVSIEAGLRHKVRIERNAKGLGLALLDFDHDGTQDIFVANDSTRNFLYLGRAGGHFEERALISGVAFNAAGKAEAGMGVAVGDFDGDQELDLFLTHLDQETNTLYRGTGDGLFVDATEATDLGRPSLPWVGFGTVSLDFDHDGDLDLFVTNGHIIDNIEQFDASRSHRQPAQLFENEGGRFREVSELLDLGEPLVGRGAAAGDLDGDGDLDLVITQNNGPALVLLNQLDAERGAITVRLEGRDSNPQGFGARLELEADSGPKQLRWLLSASSYLSQGPPEAHFGIGDAKKAKLLTVHWPSGQVDRHHDLEAGYLYTLTEGSEEIERTAFRRP